MSLAERQRTLLRVCFDASPAQSDLDTLGAKKERWLLYRRMVRSRIEGMVATGLKRSLACMGTEAFAGYVSDWFRDRPPDTRFIREVVPNFAEYLLESEAPLHPRYLRDLLRFESLRWQVGYQDVAIPTATPDFDFEKAAQCNPTLQFLRTAFPVHELPLPTEAPSPHGTAPELQEAETNHAIFRKRNDRVTSRVLTPRARRWLEALRSNPNNDPVTVCIRRIAEADNEALDAAYVEAFGATIASLLQEDALLGSRR